MSSGDDSRRGDPSATGSADQTGEAGTPTPRVVVRTPSGDGGGDTGVMSAADTAVASRSQSMAALAVPEEEGEDTLLDSTLLGRYLVTRRIGQGGMGAVYEATHTLIGKRVAVKVLLDKYATRSPIVARLEQEAKLASSIGHEHIIDITDFGQTSDGRTFVVMEYLEGESLHQTLAREGPLPEQRVIRMARQIAGALGAAHDKGVVHRDVKPENVFLLQRGDADFVKVVDFGISKSMRPQAGAEAESPRLTQTGMVLGTPLYMSPEQARGDEELDHRVDVYALGVIMYELATGRVPHQGGNYLAVISQVINDDPPLPRDLRPELSEEFEAIILKAMDKDRDHRYQSMKEVAQDLAMLVEDPGRSTARGVVSAAGWRRRRGKKRSPLNILAWTAGVAVVISAVAVTVSVTMSGSTGAAGAASEPAVALAPPDAMATPSPPDAGPAAPAVEIVEIEIVSDPPGAAIYEGGRLIGIAPVPYRTDKSSREVKLVAELEGHMTADFRFNPYVEAETGGSVQVRLQPGKDPPSRMLDRVRRTRGQQQRQPEPERPRRDDTAGGELTGSPYE